MTKEERAMTALSTPTLIERIWPATNDTKATWRFIGLALAGSALLALSAKVKLDIGPVPVTLQTFVLLAMGMLFGARLAGATVLAYLAEGAAGLPVFAGTPEKGLGLAYMMGPTGGYLVGFFLAAVAVGMLAERGWDRNIVLTALAMTIGTALIFIPGVLWLGTLIGWDKPVLALGLYPFLAGGAIKIAMAVAIFPTLWAVMKKFGRS
jgi:biotin transport system substrate-specific component